MDRLETEKYTLQAVDGSYLKLTISTDGEITKDDVPPVLDFMDQYSEPVPVLLIREGSYALSVLVQIYLYREVNKRIKAIAYVDRNHKETVLTKIAKNTYMKDAKVRSFNSEEKALNWLRQYGTLPS